ncbi:hypothetical protein [Clostridium sp.]|uniref:hypothetical protein n=1 Tax=Clostridium sp. TaxID=1506 RepID=UPI0032165AE7
MELLSNYLGVGEKIDLEGAFDQILDLDANYFINIKRLKNTDVDEFKGCYEKINDFFREIGLLLANSKSNEERLYKEAIRRFPYGEVNGIGLGYSKGTHGSGVGKHIIEKIIKDAKEIIDTGVNEPEIFHLVGLFEEKVGPDRLSDMFATLIEVDIEAYTIRINEILGINKENYPNLEFDGKYLINPYKGNRVLLLPKDILHELPIAKDWDDIDRVCKEIDKIRREFNEIIGVEWSKITTTAKKDFILTHIMKNPKHLRVLLDDYKNTDVDKYDFDSDALGEYKVYQYTPVIAKENPLFIPNKEKSSFEISLILCNKFKELTEDNKLSQLLYTDDRKPRKEKIAQLAFYGIAEAYCNANNLDISPETDCGRGPVDFKMSRGQNDKTLIEIKLTTNKNLVHGFTTQIEEYAKAERTNKKIYLVIDNGGPAKKIEDLKEIYSGVNDDANKPLLIIVDAKPKKSASKF